MADLDLERLLKLLRLTASDQDGEALNAIRAANALLKKNNKTWDAVVNYKEIPDSSRSPTDWTAKPKYPKPERRNYSNHSDYSHQKYSVFTEALHSFHQNGFKMEIFHNYLNSGDDVIGVTGKRNKFMYYPFKKILDEIIGGDVVLGDTKTHRFTPIDAAVWIIRSEIGLK